MNPSQIEERESIILKGYHKKLKTMKKKYFVLYKDTSSNVARMEYYDNERKFKSNLPPKRVIKLKNCFNINRRLDTRYDYVISLSTKDGAFGIVLETESEMIKWLEALVSLQRDDATTADADFNDFWQVTVERRGLAEEKGLIGNYYVGLTVQSLIFIRIGAEKTALGEKRLQKVDFPLITIRRCGDSQCYFYIEVGRKSVIGPGEFWMQTENSQTAQNMHSKILSAMSSKNDIEPMRKRSSSATEASKPIKVEQRRQNQQENKVNNSPQTVIGFSRERCDSLPSRNRSSSECMSQSLAASSTHSVRNFSMSGLRPHSYQRHSNSPPMSVTIGCSESEESSVSIDEPDDNSSFLTYRFNSRSSEGVIPEENTDELLGVEIKQGVSKGSFDNETLPGSLGSPGNIDENYLLMAPINIFKENRIKSTEESRYVPSNSSSLRAVRSSILEFPEYAFDKTSKNYTNETDLQFERPTRAYSIGSRAEHSKFNKRTTNLNDLDQNTMRVRAFSVGAKIPRCDLQRGVLSPKSLMEPNSNSNNNLCALNEPTVPHHLLNTATSSEKKSTSAPLLIHKSQNSVDRMSDLMEIDFSKPSNNSTNRIYTSARVPIFKNVMTATQSSNTQIQKTEENQLQKTSNLNPLIESTINQTDNGYLEMKPVGASDSLNKNSPTKHFKESSNIYSVANVIAPSSTIKKTNFTTVPENKFHPTKSYALQHQQQLQPVLQNKIEVLATCPKDVGVGNLIPLQINNKELIAESKKKDDLQEKTLRKQVPAIETISGYYVPAKTDKSELNIKDQTNLNILTAKYTQLPLDSNQKPKEIQQTENKSSDKDDYINIIRKTNEQISAQLKNNITKLTSTTVLITKEEHDKDKDKECVKLTHSNSNEENKNDESISRKSIHPSNATGYEILQIKSDSSLQAHKSLTRHNANRKDKQQQQQQQQQQICQQTPCRPRSTNSSALTTTNALNLSGGCSSSSTSALNYISTPIATKGEQLNKTNNASSTNTEATSTSASTSSSSTTTITTSPLNLVSRPPSVSSEHELYYASLDLPQPSGDISVKLNKLEISNGSSPIAEIVTSANNSYAKIDFDVSDSSSSSSKNVNVNVNS